MPLGGACAQETVKVACSMLNGKKIRNKDTKILSIEYFSLHVTKLFGQTC